ncbi:hypothetical protein EGI32_17890 [Ferruginibacter sp. HRS2-29]|nr:hypothetical protein [Ferruginibacter sp. HRS2-29]
MNLKKTEMKTSFPESRGVASRPAASATLKGTGWWGRHAWELKFCREDGKKEGVLLFLYELEKIKRIYSPLMNLLKTGNKNFSTPKPRRGLPASRECDLKGDRLAGTPRMGAKILPGRREEGGVIFASPQA